MEKDITEQLACPVCFAIPTAEIFQCKHGHTICSDCSKTLTICPQCRVPYKNEKIRNRALEMVLDARKFSCPNKDMGCVDMGFRKDIPAHLKRCEFQEIIVPICQILGYACNFKSSTKKTAETTEHFRTIHNSPYRKSSSGKIILEGFGEARLNRTSIWTPTILEDVTELGDVNNKFITFAKINGADQTMSFILMLLGGLPQEARNYSAKYLLTSHKEGEIPLEWTTPCVDIKNADIGINLPAFRIPASMLKQNYTTDGCMDVAVTIIREERKCASLSEPDPLHVSNELPEDPLAVGNENSTDYDGCDAYQLHFVTCDGCDKVIRGAFYHCLQCRGFDLCSRCRNAGVHSHHLSTKLKSNAECRALARLTYDRISSRLKELLGGDVLVDYKPFCSECRDKNMENLATSMCRVCAPLYGICEACRDKIRKVCTGHPFLSIRP